MEAYKDSPFNKRIETLKDPSEERHLFQLNGVSVFEIGLRLYFGATHENPGSHTLSNWINLKVNGIFSFFPCQTRQQVLSERKGFCRPLISGKLPDSIFTSNLQQVIWIRLLIDLQKGFRATEVTQKNAVSIWKKIVQIVFEDGLQLGVQAQLPQSATDITSSSSTSNTNGEQELHQKCTCTECLQKVSNPTFP